MIDYMYWGCGRCSQEGAAKGAGGGGGLRGNEWDFRCDIIDIHKTRKKGESKKGHLKFLISFVYNYKRFMLRICKNLNKNLPYLYFFTVFCSQFEFWSKGVIENIGSHSQTRAKPGLSFVLIWHCIIIFFVSKKVEFIFFISVPPSLRWTSPLYLVVRRTFFVDFWLWALWGLWEGILISAYLFEW